MLHDCVLRNDLDELRIIVNHEESRPFLNELDSSGYTALHLAVSEAVSEPNIEIIKVLLSAGADPNASRVKRQTFNSIIEASNLIKPSLRDRIFTGLLRRASKLAHLDENSRFKSIVEDAQGWPMAGELLRLLLESGADPSHLDSDGRRSLVGLGEPQSDMVDSLTLEDYTKGAYSHEGSSNPTKLNGPYKDAMVISGVTAYYPRTWFKDRPNYGEGCKVNGKDSAWCNSRFGQSTTLLGDGRVVFIAGEHEDSYDPNFCIYNDVIVFEPNGTFTIYGYPYSLFHPTDFHSATLVANDIFIIGSLGYQGSRSAAPPVYRLDTFTFRIEQVECSGELPPRIYEHRAVLTETGAIRISGGKQLSFEGKKEVVSPNLSVYEFDVQSSHWSKVS